MSFTLCMNFVLKSFASSSVYQLNVLPFSGSLGQNDQMRLGKKNPLLLRKVPFQELLLIFL